MTVRLAPAADRPQLPGHGEGGGAGVHHDALAIADRAGGRGPDGAFLAGLEPLAQSNAGSGRLRSGATAPPWVRTSRCSVSSVARSLRMVTVDTP